MSVIDPDEVYFIKSSVASQMASSNPSSPKEAGTTLTRTSGIIVGHLVAVDVEDVLGSNMNSL